MNFKEKLKKGESLFGTWNIIPSPEVVNILGKSGLDFMFIDCEHGLSDSTNLQRLVMASDAEDCFSIIRVSKRDEAEIGKALDSGAGGILIPHIETPGDCKTALSYMLYPPKGIRGFSPYTRAGGYSYKENYTQQANNEVLTGIIIEGTEAINNIDIIVDNPDLDFVYIGTYDISVQLGLPGKTKEPKVLDALKLCTRAVRNKGKAVGCLFHSEEELDLFREIGIQLLAYKVDSSVLFEGFSYLKRFKEKGNNHD